MNNFNKKQKIILAIILCIIIGIVYNYFYSNNNDFELIRTEETDSNSHTDDTDKEVIDKDIEALNKSPQNNGIERYKEEAEKIVVHISGAVINEGIVELKNNSRVYDAIEEAGGLKEDANIKEVNLAYKLEDGMKIHIPNNAEQEEKDIKKSEPIQSIETSNMSEYITTSEEKQNERKSYSDFNNIKVNINTATQTELETLPGIGPSTALKIINYRNENGKFTSIEAIKDVSGIGDAKFENIKEFIMI